MLSPWKTLWQCASWVGQGLRESSGWRGSPVGGVGGGLALKLTTLFLSMFIWSLLSLCPSARARGECLQVSNSVHRPFKRMFGFPAAFWLTQAEGWKPWWFSQLEVLWAPLPCTGTLSWEAWCRHQLILNLQMWVWGQPVLHFLPSYLSPCGQTSIQIFLKWVSRFIIL